MCNNGICAQHQHNSIEIGGVALHARITVYFILKHEKYASIMKKAREKKKKHRTDSIQHHARLTSGLRNEESSK